MRHYLCYDEDGNFTGTHGFTNAATGMRGWPEDYDLENQGTTNPRARSWLDGYGTLPCGFMKYDCPCPPTNANCSCAQARRQDFYRDDSGNCVAKPATVAVVDGANYDPNQILDRVPGSVSKMKLVSTDVADGTTVNIMQSGLQMLDQSDQLMELIFTNNETPEFNLTAPGQGFTGAVRAYGKFCCPITVKIRGWGS